MATTSTTAEQQPAMTVETSLLISLPALSQEEHDAMLAVLAEAFHGRETIVAMPGAEPASITDTMRIVGYEPGASSTTAWMLTAADFLNAYELARDHHAPTTLLLGAEAQSLSAAGLRSMVDASLQGPFDLVLPRYTLPPRSGLVNAAILYPISRALFGASPRFPLALDLCFSAQAGERLAAAAQRLTAASQSDGLVWPIPEVAIGGLSIGEVEVGTRNTPQPSTSDLNAVLAQVVGSLFSEVEGKAAFWQRSRIARHTPVSHYAFTSDEAEIQEAHSMIEGFQLAYVNLMEIWSLVLPPQSLLGLKRLSAMATQDFTLPDALWARIVYDFSLAYRLRTINRGHLLGAFTPLYLAWVASHLLQTTAGVHPERHIEAVATAFEAEKPYLVSRWRWPDRFNP